MARLTADEKRWQAEEDARTLLRAVEIENSKTRKKAALKEIKKIEEQAKTTIQTTRKVVKKKVARKSRKTKKK